MRREMALVSLCVVDVPFPAILVSQVAAAE